MFRSQTQSINSQHKTVWLRNGLLEGFADLLLAEEAEFQRVVFAAGANVVDEEVVLGDLVPFLTATQKDQKITITSSSGLSKEEVERMAKEADAHSAEDKAQRDSIEAKNQLDSMVYQIEKMLREQGDKISGSERGDVENAVADAKKALESNDKATMDKAREKLTAASHKLAEQMYKAAQATPGAAPGGPTPGATGGGDPSGNGQAKKDEGVIDAEYVDVEDKK